MFAPLLVLLGALTHPITPAALAYAPASEDVSLSRARRVERLIEDGQLDDARQALATQEFSALVRATLEGRLALADGDPTHAAKRFAEAMKLAPDHAPLRILAAHALLAAERLDEVVDVLDHPDLDHRAPRVALLRARALEGQGDTRAQVGAAYDTLVAAAQAHPQHLGLRRELVLLCVRHHLYTTARAWAESVTPAQLGRDVVLVILQQSRAERAAVPFALALAAAFEDDREIQAQLGWALSAAGHTVAAARAFEHATALGSDLAYVAAEHHRAAGRHRRALAMNAHVQGDKKRAQQRFDVLFEQGSMARAIVAGEALERAHGLSARRRYNLAYAHYALQQYADATTIARALEGTSEAQRAATLLRAMGRRSR